MTRRWRRPVPLALCLPVMICLAGAGAAPTHAAPSCATLAVVNRFAGALAARRYPAMWALLGRAGRAAWGGDAGLFARYERAKFAALLGALPARADPGHTALAGQTASVRLRWSPPAGDGPRLLDGYPVRVGPNATGRCAVLDGGFSAPDTPLVVPVRPAHRSATVPILMYHNISERPLTAGSLLYGLTVSDAGFAAQLAYLRDHGYHTITLVRLFEYLYYDRPLPHRPIVLTFDDGYDNAYADAFPLLRRYGAVGVFNVITGKVGLRHDGVNSYTSWPQLAQMRQAGMEIESHTVYHEDLGLVSRGQARREALLARIALRQHLGVPAQFLTYPSGEPFRSGSAAAQTRVLGLVAAAGYVGALLDQRVPSTLQQAALPYQLPRIRVDGGEPLAAFAASLAVQ